MRQYFVAFKEIIFSAIALVLFAADLVAFGVSSFSPSVTFPQWFYISLLIVGFLLGAIKRVADKNKQLAELSNRNNPQPVLMLYVDKRYAMGYFRFRVRPHCIEPIKNITVKPLKIGTATLQYKLRGSNVVKHDEERHLDLIPSIHSQEELSYVMGVAKKAFSIYATKTYKLVVTYEDSQRKYKVSYLVGREDPQMLEQVVSE